MKSTQRLQSTQTPSKTMTDGSDSDDMIDFQPASIGDQLTHQRQVRVNLKGIAAVERTTTGMPLATECSGQRQTHQGDATQSPIDGIVRAMQAEVQRDRSELLV